VKKLYTPYTWAAYSEKLRRRIENPRYAGRFTQENAALRRMRLVVGCEGSVELFWLVDESDGVIADARFYVFGPSALIGAAEAASELLMRKNYDQARRVSADLIDRQMRDKTDVEAFPYEAGAYLNLVLEAIENGADQCTDIPFADTYAAPPIDFSTEGEQIYAGWKELSKESQIAIIEEVIQKEIRPYIELDAGGVQIVDLIDSSRLIIAYQGACTSCHSATGATLSAIQHILQAKVWPDIVVEPDLSMLKFDQGTPV